MAYQFDNAVTLFGLTVDNALQGRRNAGTQKNPQWEPKYTLAQLLDDTFRLPRPERPEKQEGVKGLMQMKGVKVWKG